MYFKLQIVLENVVEKKFAESKKDLCQTCYINQTQKTLRSVLYGLALKVHHNIFGIFTPPPYFIRIVFVY